MIIEIIIVILVIVALIFLIGLLIVMYKDSYRPSKIIELLSDENLLLLNLRKEKQIYDYLFYGYKSSAVKTFNELKHIKKEIKKRNLSRN